MLEASVALDKCSKEEVKKQNRMGFTYLECKEYNVTSIDISQRINVTLNTGSDSDSSIGPSLEMPPQL